MTGGWCVYDIVVNPHYNNKDMMRNYRDHFRITMRAWMIYPDLF